MNPTSVRNESSTGQTSKLNEVLRHPAMKAVVLMAMVVLAYWPALRAGFIMDDDLIITHNPLLTAPHGLWEIWFTTHSPSQYFPLVYSTFWLEHALWGFHPLGYHLINILWHGVNAVLVWMLLRRLRVPAAWLAAAVFAVHPVEVETVAWSAELKNIESLFFCLLSLLAWLKFIDLPDASRWRYYGLAFAAFLLALFAKTTACTIPAALVLLLWLRHQRLDGRRVIQIVPFVVAGLIMGLVSIWWEKHLGDYQEPFPIAFTPVERLLIASRAIWFYVGKLLLPANLTFSYPLWQINPDRVRQYVPVAACLVAVVLLWQWRNKVGRGALAGILFFVATLSPLLGLVVEGTFHYTYVADHYQYAASIGLIAVVVALTWRWLATSAIWKPLQVMLLLSLAALTWRQCGVYHNLISLWKDTLAKNPNSWMAHHNLGIEYFERGQEDLAIKEYRTAVKLYPQGCPEQSDLGTALLEQGHYDEAIEHLKKALAINPRHFPAQNNLALAYSRIGNYPQAELHFKAALKLDPKALGTSLNFGRMLEREGKPAAALDCFREAVQQHPTNVPPMLYLASALLATGSPNKAVDVCQRAMQIEPKNVNVWLSLGNAFCKTKNYDAAVATYRKALKLAPGNAALHYNLGLVLNLQGKHDEARQEMREALQSKQAPAEAVQKLILSKARP